MLPVSRARSPAGTAPGWVAGTVVDSVYATPVVGATVGTSAGAAGCGNCSSGTTNATGFFRVEADPGPITVSFYDASYVPNVTAVTVTSGQVLSIGTVEMVHFATVSGRVVADVPGLPALGKRVRLERLAGLRRGRPGVQ